MAKTKGTKAEGKKLLDNKRVVLVISFVVAIFAWMIIGGWVMPNETKMINNVAINYTRGSSDFRNKNLELVGTVLEEASVKVSGDGSTLLELSNTDVTVYCDYSAVTEAGTYTIPLKAENVATGFNIDEVVPATITLQFENIQRTTFTLSVTADSVLAADGYYKSDAEVSTQQIEVSGPESEMANIKGAAVIISDSVERTTTYTVSDAAVVLLDANGEIVNTSDLVSISPSVVSVEIPILMEKELPITVGIVGAPSSFDEDWFNSLITLTRSTIVVAGETSQLENITEISVGEIDISTFQIGSTYESFNVTLPSGLKNISGIQTIGVSLNVETLAQRTYQIPLQDVAVTNEPANISVTPADILDSEAYLEITLIGEATVLDSILPEDISVQIYAANASADGSAQQTLPVRVYVPRSGRVFATGSYTLLCDITGEAADASGS